MNVGQRLGIELKAPESGGLWLCVPFVKGLHRMFLFFFSVWEVEHAEKKPDMCGDRWKDQDLAVCF